MSARRRRQRHRFILLASFAVLVLVSCVYWKPTSLESWDETTTPTTTVASSYRLQQHINRDIGFVHVGKTGGATLSQLIRRACLTREGCRKHAQRLDALLAEKSEESIVSQQVTRYYHQRAVATTRHTSFLVTLRDPLDRAASWYIFRHPQNGGRLDVAATRNPVLLRLFDCYPTLDELATIGLSSSSSSSSSRPETDECSQLARRIMMGTIQPTRDGDHMAWNYAFYLTQILQNKEPELWVLRTEQLWKDWDTINTMMMMGGTSTTTHNHTHVEVVTHQRQPLPVHNKTISPTGMDNLCCALRHDLYVYARTLRRALNLHADQVQESLDRLEAKCGSLSILARKCRHWDRRGRTAVWDQAKSRWGWA